MPDLIEEIEGPLVDALRDATKRLSDLTYAGDALMERLLHYNPERNQPEVQAWLEVSTRKTNR